MNKMNIEKILASGLINISELSRRLWPNIKNPVVKLQNKIARRAGQRLTNQDKELIVKIFIDEFGFPPVSKN
jgi:hypothetical protein